MKKLIALLLALFMLSSVCAFAEEKVETLYTAEDGTIVTLTMKGEYTLENIEDGSSNYRWIVHRDGVADVWVSIAPLEETVGLNDLSEEEIAEIMNFYYEGSEDYLTLSLELTPSGNKYLDFFWDFGDSQSNERWTYFEGFELNRFQNTTDEHPVLTEEDTAFLAEVQEGMWVTFPTAK